MSKKNVVNSNAGQTSLDFDWSQPVAKKEEELELNWDDDEDTNKEKEEDEKMNDNSETDKTTTEKPDIREF